MPISATGNNAPAWRPCRAGHASGNGFTLIELLVALTILGLMSAVVVFALADPQGRLLDEAERFASRAAAARDTAIVSARTTRMAVDSNGYAFAQRRDGRWQGIASKPLAPARWATGTSATKAEVEFDPTGLAAPEARILVRRGDESIAVDIGADGAVHVAK